MKKFYSLVAVAMLSLTTAMAQSVAPISKNFEVAAKKHVSANIKTVSTVQIEGIKREGTAVKPMLKAPKSKVATRAIAANQKYYGAYSSDAYETESAYGLGIPSVTGDLKVATFLPSGYFSNVADSKIVGMRFALTNPAIVKNAFIYAEDMEGNISEVASKSFRTLGNTSAGWTEVTFNAPVTVDFSKINGLMIGYTYTQVASGASARPISMVDEGDFIAESYMYGNFNTEYGTGWYDVGLTNFGNLSVQLLLENDKFLTNDAVVNEMIIEKNWYKAGDEMKYAALVKNFGAGTIGNVVLGTAIDGIETSSTITLENVNSGSGAQGSINLPADIALGKHTLKVFVKSMDGGASTGNTDDDYLEKTFYVYSKEVARQKNLVEQFTSQWCTNCPDGTTNLEKFVATRNNDIAWVAVHGNMGNYEDDFYLEENNYLMYFQNATYYPSASFNRTVVNDGTTIFGINIGSSATTEQINEYFKNILDYTTTFTPALATVNISGSYDEATRKLDVTVSGSGADAAKVLTDMGINVFLTESGLVADQGFSDGYMHSGYTHNNVSRGALTNVLGDDIKWNGDNYENTYSITLPAEWNVDNMEVIAFMSTKIVNGFDINNECVTNANSVKLTNISTGIKGVYNNGADAVETARYNAAGQVISAPQKGLNIIKMSNGETRKVIVK